MHDGTLVRGGFDHAAARSALAGSVGAAGPQKVFVGLYVLAITSVEQSKGQFGLDAYLYLSSPQGAYSGSCPASVERSCSPHDSISRILVNAKDLAVTSINKFASDRNTTTQFRIKGTLTATFQYQQWPFESTQLEVSVEDPVRSNTSLELVPLDSFTALSPTVSAPGWTLHAAENRTTIVAKAVAVRYARQGDEETFSRAVFYVLLSRPSLSAFLKYLLPPSLILVMQVFAMFITPESVATRVSMAGSGLVSAVLFHTQLTAQTPPADYLVFSDRFMLATYFVIVVNGIGAIFVIKAKSKSFGADTRREAAAWQAHGQSEAVSVATLLAATATVASSWVDGTTLPVQVLLGALPPVVALVLASTLGAALTHAVCGCHCVTPADVLLAANRKQAAGYAALPSRPPQPDDDDAAAGRRPSGIRAPSLRSRVGDDDGVVSEAWDAVFDQVCCGGPLPGRGRLRPVGATGRSRRGGFRGKPSEYDTTPRGLLLVGRAAAVPGGDSEGAEDTALADAADCSGAIQ